MSALGAVRRMAADDVLADEAETLVLLRDGRVVRLSGLGPLIWDLSEEWIDVARLHAVIVDVLGDAPDSRQLVDDAVRALVGVAVLSSRDPLPPR